MKTNDALYQEAEWAIRRLFEDTSVDLEDALRNLRDLESLIRTLRESIEESLPDA